MSSNIIATQKVLHPIFNILSLMNIPIKNMNNPMIAIMLNILSIILIDISGQLPL